MKTIQSASWIPFRFLVLLVSITLSLSTPCRSHEGDLTAQQIIDKYLDTQRADSELALIRMKTYLPGGLNSIIKRHRFVVLTKKNDTGGYSYVLRMIEPSDVEGVTVLANEKGRGAVDQYIYLPDVGQVTKISPDNRSGYFLGSDFTFEDLVREIPRNFEYTTVGEMVIHGAECHIIRAKPSEKAKRSYYAYRDLYIEKGNYLLHQIEFYLTGDKMIKTFEAFEYDSPKVEGESVRPRNAVMTNLEKNSVTIFNVVESRLNIELDSELFTQKSIKSWTAQEMRDLVFDYGITVTAEE